MDRELCRDVFGGRGMAGEVGEHRAALREAGVGIGLAEHGLGARLVRPRDKHELAADVGVGDRRPQGPTGQRLCEADHVGLGVAGAHAERVQFQDLAREILVEPLAAIDAGDRVGPIDWASFK